MFKESYIPKKNPYNKADAWEVKVVSQIEENIGEYYSDDPLPSTPDDNSNDEDDGFKPMTLEQRRMHM